MSLPAWNLVPDSAAHRLLTLPHSPAGALSIRAKALVFRDPRSAALLDRVDRIARSDASVLLIGETGTGKELIARHIHAESQRPGPFVPVNCGAFSESLIDAELFGHESGAFTGASQARAGWFEAANGGTLFLDEIGDLPLALQVKLLRVLQERQVVRLGSRKAIPLDIRLVAATNVDLARAIEAGRFRRDLYYRLDVASVPLPPLRERTGDILPLARHFIEVHAPRLALKNVSLSAEAQSALLGHAWPGNIRELENVIHFALIVCQQGAIQAHDLKLVPVVAGLPEAALEDQSPVPPPGSPAQRLLAEALQGLLDEQPARLFRQVESALVRAAFDRVNENQVHAARLLGITRNTLRTLLKRHGLLTDAPVGSPEARVEPQPRAH